MNYLLLVGRLGFYSDAHLARLEHVARLQERGFSLAAIREIVSGLQRGDTIAALMNLADEQDDDNIDRLVEKAFPDERESAAPIQNAIKLGVLRFQDGHLEPTDENHRPLVLAILHLFALGISEERAFQVWAGVVEHIAGVANVFIEVAEEFAYGSDTPKADAEVFMLLARTADRVVSFALHAALEERLRGDSSSVWS